MSTTQQTLSIFWRATNRYRLLLWVGIIGAVTAVIVQDIIPPYIIAKTFAKLQKDYSQGLPLSFADYTNYFLIYLAAMLTGVAIWRVQAYCVWLYEIRTQRDLAIRVFKH